MGCDDGPVAGPIYGRCLTDDLAKGSTEGSEARESDVEADVGDAPVGLAQEEHRPLDPSALEVAMGRLAEDGPEAPAEMRGRDMGDRRDRRHVEWFRIRAVHRVAGAQEAAVEILGFAAHPRNATASPRSARPASTGTWRRASIERLRRQIGSYCIEDEAYDYASRVTHHADASAPPFVGLRRHARALAVGFALVVGILVLVPDLTPRTGAMDSVLLVHGRIIEIEAGSTPSQPNARVVVIDGVRGGPAAGDVVEGFVQGTTQSAPDYRVGDDVIVEILNDADIGFVAIADRYRVPTLGLLLGLFAAAVVVVGGWRGVRSLIALALTLAVVTRIVIPLILTGWDPAWVAILAATGVTVVSFVLTEGARAPTLAAAGGTAISLVLVAVLATVFDALSRFTPLRGSEETAYLISLGGTSIDLGGVVLAAVIFGALGVLDDVTITQAATVQELHEADPVAGRATVAARAMNVGRSHISATVNTLVLAYVGASLPLLILFVAGGQDPSLIASEEVVAVEIVRALTGSVGIVAAVPLTTAIAVALIGRRIPGLERPSRVHRAPGWDG